MPVLFSIGIGLAIALVYFPFSNKATSTLRSTLKTLPLLCFCLAAYLAGAPALLGLGLFLSALGDFALSRDGKRAFLYGLSAFALAHLVYILLFLNHSSIGLAEVFFIAPFAASAMILLAVSSEFWLAPYTGSLRWPVRVYILLITLMGFAALTHATEIRLISETGEAMVLSWQGLFLRVGAGSFILSDLILSIRMFRMADANPRKSLASFAVWLFYIAGQTLILLSFVV